MMKVLLPSLILLAWSPQYSPCNTRDIENCESYSDARDLLVSATCNESSYSISYDTDFYSSSLYFMCGEQCLELSPNKTGIISGRHNSNSEVETCEVLACFEYEVNFNLEKYKHSTSCQLAMISAPPTTDTTSLSTATVPDIDNTMSPSTDLNTTTPDVTDTSSLNTDATTSEENDTTSFSTDNMTTSLVDTTSSTSTIILAIAGVVPAIVISVLVFILLVITCIVCRKERHLKTQHLRLMYFESTYQLQDDPYHVSVDINESFKLDLGSQTSLYYPLHHNTIPTDKPNLSKSDSGISTSPSQSFSTKELITSASDSEDRSDEQHLDSILHSPSYSESSVYTEMQADLFNSRETETHYVDSNFRKAEYKLDSAYVRSEETDTNLDLRQDPAEQMKSDSYLQHDSREPEVDSTQAQDYSQLASDGEMEGRELSIDLDTDGVKFEFGDGSNSFSEELSFEFYPNHSAKSSYPDYLLSDEFGSDASSGYLSSVHKHFDTTSLLNDVDFFSDLVMEDEQSMLKTNFSTPYIRSDNVFPQPILTLPTYIPSPIHSSSLSISSGYISSDMSDSSLSRTVHIFLSPQIDEDLSFFEEIPIYNAYH